MKVTWTEKDVKDLAGTVVWNGEGELYIVGYITSMDKNPCLISLADGLVIKVSIDIISYLNSHQMIPFFLDLEKSVFKVNHILKNRC